MEFTVKTIQSFGRLSVGCRNSKRDVMIAFTQEDEPVKNAVHDRHVRFVWLCDRARVLRLSNGLVLHRKMPSE